MEPSSIAKIRDALIDVMNNDLDRRFSRAETIDGEEGVIGVEVDDELFFVEVKCA